MNKQDLIDALASELKSTKKDSAQIVDAVIAVITKGLRKDGNIQLTGFGVFRAKKMAAKLGHNPRTGESIEIAERTQVFFSAGKGLKSALNAPAKAPKAAAKAAPAKAAPAKAAPGKPALKAPVKKK
jgi:DNA-binding protein HU-beta